MFYVHITLSAVASMKLSQMTWLCESIRWRSALADSPDSNLQPAPPQWRGRFGQLASSTSRFPLRMGLLQNLQGNGRFSIQSVHSPKSTTVLKVTALPTRHSRSLATCSSQSTWWQPAQHTGFVTTFSKLGIPKPGLEDSLVLDLHRLVGVERDSLLQFKLLILVYCFGKLPFAITVSYYLYNLNTSWCHLSFKVPGVWVNS